MRIVSVVSGPHGHFLVSTNRRRNSVREQLHGREIANWSGKEVTVACSVDNKIVCAALDGRLYVVSETGVESLKHNDAAAWWSAGAAFGNRLCQFGGDLGRLLIFNADTKEFHHDALRKHNIDRPGRDILHVLKHEDELFLLGTKEFLVRYHADRFTSCLGPSHSETFFESAVWLDGKLWIVAHLEGNNLLAEYKPVSGQIVYHSLEIIPPLNNATLFAWNGQLYLGKYEIFRGRPGAWQKIGHSGKHPVIHFLPVPGQPNSLMVMDSKGQTKLIAT